MKMEEIIGSFLRDMVAFSSVILFIGSVVILAIAMGQ